MNADKFYRNFFIVVVTIVATIVLYQARSLLTPVLFALLVAYILYPVVTVAARIGIGKGMSIFMIFVIIAGSLTYVASTLLPAVKNEVAPFITTNMAAANNGTSSREDGIQETPEDLFLEKVDASNIEFSGVLAIAGTGRGPSVVAQKETASEAREKWRERMKASKLLNMGVDLSRQLHSWRLIPQPLDAEELVAQGQTALSLAFGEWDTVLKSIGGAAKDIFQFAMIFFIVLIFALLDGNKIYKGILQLIPNTFFEPGVFILKKTSDMLGYYLRGLFVENLILCIITFALLLVLIAFSELTAVLALAIALIIALTNIIRIIGPIVGAAIGAALALISTSDFVAMLGILGIAGFVQVLDNVVILPLVMKEQVNIHPVMCVLGILTGGLLAGVLGMILAIPVMGGIKVIYTTLSREMKKFNMDPDMIPDIPISTELVGASR